MIYFCVYFDQAAPQACPFPHSKRNALEPLALAHAIVDVATELMASDVVMLDISELTVIADYFIVVTGDSERQIAAISERVVEELREKQRVRALAVEGTPASGWMLVDYGSVILHIFSPQQRAHVRLEELWSKARTVVHIV
ncbi:MAG: ribosome silencing factor [Anaerolineae bacterium]